MMMAAIASDLSHVLTALLVPLVLGGLLYLARRQATVQVREGRLVLRYGWALQTIEILAALMAGLMMFLAIQARPDQRGIAMVVVLGFVLLAVVLGLEVFGVRVEFDADTIWCFSPWRRNRAIPWAEIERVTFSHVNQWWIVRTRTGALGSIRLSQFLTGVEDFLTAARARDVRIDGPVPAPVRPR